MAARRKDDVLSNLAFSFESNRELNTLISEAQRTDEAVKHISQKAAAILASVRECYDYCASDIKDDYLLGERQKVYYPFHPDSLMSNSVQYFPD